MSKAALNDVRDGGRRFGEFSRPSWRKPQDTGIDLDGTKWLDVSRDSLFSLYTFNASITSDPSVSPPGKTVILNNKRPNL